MSQTGALLDQIVAAGANNLSGITFMIDDAKALEQQARDQAIANARMRAEAMAKAAGATVGQVYSITENIGSTPPMPVPMAPVGRELAAGASVPVEAGEQTITAQVQITFELQ
ncbi:MAG: hypothetical protein CYG59_11480 [Chloroflexi bacterium]|nr:MAG: hypothetical protein CYG59_11480 [Chloroflexota bacterium]